MWHHTHDKSLLLGWDRPLQGYYLVIYPKHDPKGEHPDHLWANLDFETPHPEDFAVFERALELFDVELPEEVYCELDRQKREGRGPKHPLVFK